MRALSITIGPMGGLGAGAILSFSADFQIASFSIMPLLRRGARTFKSKEDISSDGSAANISAALGINPAPSAETPAGTSTGRRSRRRGSLGSTVVSSEIATRLVMRLEIPWRNPNDSILFSIALDSLSGQAASSISASSIAARPNKAPMGIDVVGRSFSPEGASCKDRCS